MQRTPPLINLLLSFRAINHSLCRPVRPRAQNYSSREARSERKAIKWKGKFGIVGTYSVVLCATG
jgi:hypothetical protein